MRKTQDVILEAVEQAVADHKLLPTISYNFGNIGVVTGLDKESLDTVVTIGFDFQTNYFHLYLHEGLKRINRQPERTLSNINGTPTSTILAELWEWIERKVKA